MADEVITGLVQVITGDGKGKTTSALGTVIRALGQGLRVRIIVFMKGDYPYGEWKFLEGVANVNFTRFGSREFIKPKGVSDWDRDQAKQALAAAREAMLSGDYDIVMLDEVNLAVAWEIIPLDEVVKLIQDKPQGVELILTGRSADGEIVKLADLVTECINIKHPYAKGIKARKGIEY